LPLDPADRRFAFWLALALAAAAAVRTLLLHESVSESPFALLPYSDGELYWRRAGEIAAGRLAEDGPFQIAPLYPYLLGALRAAGAGLPALYAIQLALGLASAALLADAVRRRFGRGAGLCAAVLFLLLAEPALFATRVLSVGVQVFLAALALREASRIAPHATPLAADAARVGACVGLLALAFPAALLLVPALAAWLVLRSGAWPARARLAAAGAGAALLIVAPATVHNALRSGEWIPITAHGGITLAQGNSPASIGIYTPLPDVGLSILDQHRDAARAFEAAQGRPGSWREIDAWFRGRAVRFWLSEPGAAAALLAAKLRWFASAHRYDNVAVFALEREHGLWDAAVWVPLELPWLLGFALLGAALVLRERRGAWPELALAALPLFVCAVFYYSARYRLVGAPAACALAAVGLGGWRRLPWPRAALAGAILLPVSLAVWNDATGFERLDFMREPWTRELAAQFARSGAAWEAAGELDLAEQHYRRGAAAGSPEARRRLYNRLVAGGRLAEAADVLRELVAAEPRDVEARLALAWLLATAADTDTRRPEEAVRQAREALVIAGDADPQAWLTLALAEAARGGFAEAGAALARARQLAAASGDPALVADLASLAPVLGTERAVASPPRRLQVARR
jgi:tetratricopeptide (TPR) repeat protein